VKTSVTLKKPIWNTPARRKILSEVVFESALSLEGDIKDVIASSRPAGRTYRLGAITSNRKSSQGLGLKSRNKNGKKQTIVGANFHRASAKGQPPAIRTGGLLNSIRTKKIAQLRAKVFVGKFYGGILDAKDGLDRPFFAVTVEKQKEIYLERMRAEMKRLT
jgi:hypothetical protein